MYILGLNAYHGDAAAALIKDGQLVAAAEEERFRRIKHCAGFPTQSIQYCLRTAGIDIEQVEHVGISRDPSAHLHKKVLAAARRAVGGGQWAVGRKKAARLIRCALLMKRRTGRPRSRQVVASRFSRDWKFAR
jgi:carbamoyltransferase